LVANHIDLCLLRQSQRIPDGWLTAREISIPDYKSTTQVNLGYPDSSKMMQQQQQQQQPRD